MLARAQKQSVRGTHEDIDGTTHRDATRPDCITIGRRIRATEVAEMQHDGSDSIVQNTAQGKCWGRWRHAEESM